MAIGRLDNFNIGQREFFSAIYGPGITDLFIDTDLWVGGLREALYRTLRSQGYKVVFYSQNTDLNFFSFRKDDLVDFFGLRPTTTAASSAPQNSDSGRRRYVAPIDSPFGRRRRGASAAGGASVPAAAPQSPGDDDPNEYTQIQTCLSGIDTYYRVAASVDPFAQINSYIRRNPTNRIVFVFPTAQSDYYENVEQLMPFFDDWKSTFHSRHYAARILLLFSSKSESSLFEEADGQLFLRPFFKETLAGLDANGRIIAGSSQQFYCLGGPRRDEFQAFLNRRRLLDGIGDMMSSYGKESLIASRMAQIVTPKVKNQPAIPGVEETLRHYLRMTPDQLRVVFDDNMKGDAMTRLRSMKGMEKILAQIDRYLESLKYARQNPGMMRFRPHLAFIGSPGTGKTTVAKLLAQHLQQEGLLERGHLIEATAGDLIGQYVGETRIKTQALCDRARGGVLFIDEAYGLMSGADGAGEHVDYGKEAIEVLIQFMENDSGSLVILAGYKEQIENLITHGNQGFRRRFNGKESFIEFTDYEPEALIAIFRAQLASFTTTPEFDRDMERLITSMHARRNANWGNAGEMENLATSIKGRYIGRRGTGPLTVEDIPEDKLLMIADDIPVDDIMAQINALEGLTEIKEKLSMLLLSTVGKRAFNMANGIVNDEKPNLNFIFSGNPGTGKTTVANLMADILYRVGLITTNETVVLTKDSLVKSLQGGTVAAVRRMFEDHSGKVILIDEAHNLIEGGGHEAIGALTACLLDKRFYGNQAVILAGYDAPMNRLLATDVGLKRRFENIWHFEDYPNSVLWSILLKEVEARHLRFADEEDARQLAYEWLDDMRRRNGQEFGNVGTVKTLCTEIVNRHFARLARTRSNSPAVGNLLENVDFPNGANAAPRSSSPVPHPSSPSSAAMAPGADRNFAFALPADDDSRYVADPAHFIDAVGLVVGSAGQGSGFFINIDEGLILTASHVVEQNSELLFLMRRGNVQVGATLVWNDPLRDLALLRADSVPAGARHFRLDSDSTAEPRILDRILHCGFVKGTAVSDNFSTYEGTISNYDPEKTLGDRRFNAIFSGIEAINGCSGGPVMRAADFTVIGTLQGGFNDAPARVITDVHHLFTHPNLSITK